MTDKQLIAEQARTIKVLRGENEIYKARLDSVRNEFEYLHEYLRILKTNLNKHMSNPKLYPKGRQKRSEH